MYDRKAPSAPLRALREAYLADTQSKSQGKKRLVGLPALESLEENRSFAGTVLRSGSRHTIVPFPERSGVRFKGSDQQGPSTESAAKKGNLKAPLNPPLGDEHKPMDWFHAKPGDFTRTQATSKALLDRQLEKKDHPLNLLKRLPGRMKG